MWSFLGVWPTTRRFLSSPLSGKYVSAALRNSAKICSNTVSAILLPGFVRPVAPHARWRNMIEGFSVRTRKGELCYSARMVHFGCHRALLRTALLKCAMATVYQMVNRSEHLALGTAVPNVCNGAVRACMTTPRLRRVDGTLQYRACSGLRAGKKR